MFQKLNINKALAVSVSLAVLLSTSYVGSVMAASDRINHPFQKKRLKKKLEDQAKDIPVYIGADMPDREFSVMKLVRADGLFTKTNDKVFLKLKVKVLQEHGDAIVGVLCKKVGQSIGVSCYGDVVQWK